MKRERSTRQIGRSETIRLCTMDIFETRQFYAKDGEPLKRHYASHFDSIYIGLMPFIRFENDSKCSSFQKTHEISFEEAAKGLPELEKIPRFSAEYYSNQNDDYPDDTEILKHGIPVRWEEVKLGCNFVRLEDVNKALKTTIGAYRKEFSREDLADRLSAWTEENRIFVPSEGQFNVFSKIAILKGFRHLRKSSILVEDEYGERKNEIDISDISDDEFIQSLECKDYYIYDVNKELLFALDWDDFFFLICSSEEKLGKLTRALNLEGFYCDDATKQSWELSQEEIRTCLAEIEQQNQIRLETGNKWPWWKIW